jgi:hypothetical protein
LRLAFGGKQRFHQRQPRYVGGGLWRLIHDLHGSVVKKLTIVPSY